MSVVKFIASMTSQQYDENPKYFQKGRKNGKSTCTRPDFHSIKIIFQKTVQRFHKKKKKKYPEIFRPKWQIDSYKINYHIRLVIFNFQYFILDEEPRSKTKFGKRNPWIQG